MYISRCRNFIFLHSRKTAGSSISVALARHARPDDIMIGSWADAYRSHIPYNEFALGIARQKPLAYNFSVLKNTLRYGRRTPRPGFVNRAVKAYFLEKYGFEGEAHTAARKVRDFDPELWERAFKFAFVRNPWTHAVSNYYWCLRGQRGHGKPVAFKEFLRRMADPTRPDREGVRPYVISNWDVYTIDDRIAVDFVGRFENLEQDLKTISDKLGFDLSIARIGAKKGVRTRKKSIAAHYDEESIELVRQIYRKEIDAFSYQLPF